MMEKCWTGCSMASLVHSEGVSAEASMAEEKLSKDLSSAWEVFLAAIGLTWWPKKGDELPAEVSWKELASIC